MTAPAGSIIERVAPGLQRFRQDREDRIQIQLSKNQRRCAAHKFIGNIKMRIKWEQEPNSSIHVQRVNGCFLAGVSLHSSIKGGVLRRSRRTVRGEDDIGVRVVQLIVNKIRVVLCRYINIVRQLHLCLQITFCGGGIFFQIRIVDELRNGAAAAG